MSNGLGFKEQASSKVAPRSMQARVRAPQIHADNEASMGAGQGVDEGAWGAIADVGRGAIADASKGAKAAGKGAGRGAEAARESMGAEAQTDRLGARE
ncbi:unnamed protein product [Ilex paraguariensis]|uniref:Uncharacterized protein n=1 Tax=Ilex paraguariensis TaxID=185542 RepID=A0ABC8TPD0_9AQUA